MIFCYVFNGNLVGNCYFKCKMRKNINGGCVNNVYFFFGFKGIICLCMCNYNFM